MKHTELHETLGKLLNERLKRFSSTPGRKVDLNLVTCTEVYTTIFDALVELITKAEIELTNESVNYLSQCYYDSILVNNNQELDPDIFTQRASLSRIETKEIKVLAAVLGSTDFVHPIIEELKKRS